MRPDFRRKPELTPATVPTLDEQRFTLGRKRMAKRTYRCSWCGNNHFYGSKTSRDHQRLIRRQTPSSRSSPPAMARGFVKPRPARPKKPPRVPSPTDRGADRRADRRARNREALTRRLADPSASFAVAIIFKPDSVYGVAADELLKRVPWYRRSSRGHWLCKVLEDASKAIDPATYTAAVGEGVTRTLRDAGMPEFAATVLGKSAAFGAGRAIGTVGTDQIILGLRAMVPLVCPDFERCPAQAVVCTTLLKPEVEGLLRQAGS